MECQQYNYIWNLCATKEEVLSVNGYKKLEEFSKFQDQFIGTKLSGPVILIPDSHCTYVSNPSTPKEDTNKDIILLHFPPHCTQKLRPLDVVNKLKNFSKSICILCTRKNTESAWKSGIWTHNSEGRSHAATAISSDSSEVVAYFPSSVSTYTFPEAVMCTFQSQKQKWVAQVITELQSLRQSHKKQAYYKRHHQYLQPEEVLKLSAPFQVHRRKQNGNGENPRC